MGGHLEALLSTDLPRSHAPQPLPELPAQGFCVGPGFPPEWLMRPGLESRAPPSGRGGPEVEPSLGGSSSGDPTPTPGVFAWPVVSASPSRRLGERGGGVGDLNPLSSDPLANMHVPELPGSPPTPRPQRSGAGWHHHSDHGPSWLLSLPAAPLVSEVLPAQRRAGRVPALASGVFRKPGPLSPPSAVSLQWKCLGDPCPALCLDAPSSSGP